MKDGMATMWRIGLGLALAFGIALPTMRYVRHPRELGSANAAEFRAERGETIPPTVIGMNLGNHAYWTSEWAFDDIVQTTGNLRYGWAEITNQIQRDATEHPVDVPEGTKLTVIIQQDAPRTPVGSFRCHISKGWDVQPFGDWTKEGSGNDFKMKASRAESKYGIVLMLRAASPHANLTELSCRPDTPGPIRLFNSTFLADNKPFRVIRFMDWMQTNNALHREWSQRATPAFFSQAGEQGVALEHMVELANELGSDPWFTLPFDADPHYYRNFAAYVRDHLASDRKVYVEFSNEVWNTSFGQGREAIRLGQLRYPGTSASQASDFYYADRVRDVMGIWSDVYRAQEKRLVRVLATQAVNPRRAEEALMHDDTWRSVDAVASAPYFGTSGEGIAPVNGSRIDGIFSKAPQLVDEAIGYAHAVKHVAGKYHLRYISYEGGPDFSSPRPDLQPDLKSVNQDPRIHDIYARFLRRWQAEIGDVLVLYDSVSDGAYGHRKYTGQPLSEAPKARAVTEFARNL